MDLRNTKRHMQGMGITVCGRVYQLDDQGVVRGVEEEHGRRLLQGRDWILLPPVLGASPGLSQAQAPAPAPGLKAPPAPVVPVEAEPAPLEPVTPEAVEAPVVPELVDPEVEVKPAEREWPEPSLDMKGPFLRDMADAFGVKIPPGASKAKIVALIKKAKDEDENPGSESKDSAG